MSTKVMRAQHLAHRFEAKKPPAAIRRTKHRDALTDQLLERTASLAAELEQCKASIRKRVEDWEETVRNRERKIAELELQLSDALRQHKRDLQEAQSIANKRAQMLDKYAATMEQMNAALILSAVSSSANIAPEIEVKGLLEQEPVGQYTDETKGTRSQQQEKVRWIWKGDGDNAPWHAYDDASALALESAFHAKTSGVSLRIGQQYYLIDLVGNVQINTTTQTKRPVQREQSWETVEVTTLPACLHDKSDDYRGGRTPSANMFTLMPLQPTSAEYELISDRFIFGSNSRSSFRVVRIERLYHPQQSARYAARKAQMRNPSEVMLFHGTRSTSYLLPVSEGLDVRMGGGQSYLGRGIYGSLMSDYSHSYAHSLDRTHYVVLYVKFLLGSVYCASKRETFARPPLRTPLARYDSVRLQADGTTMYTVYDNSQCCVAYVIHYCIG